MNGCVSFSYEGETPGLEKNYSSLEAAFARAAVLPISAGPGQRPISVPVGFGTRPASRSVGGAQAQLSQRLLEMRPASASIDSESQRDRLTPRDDSRVPGHRDRSATPSSRVPAATSGW